MTELIESEVTVINMLRTRLSEQASTMLDRVADLSLRALCLEARAVTDEAHTLILEVSDQGPWMSFWRLDDASGDMLDDSVEVIGSGTYDRLLDNTYPLDLPVEGYGTGWQRFATSETGLRYEVNIDKVLAEVTV